jgi:hypothetical protein
MQVAEQRDEVQAKRSREPEERNAEHPRPSRDNEDSAVHVLVFAALTAFIVLVVAEGLKFGDATTLALTVFFVTSIAGAALGPDEKRGPRLERKPQIAPQPHMKAETAADSGARELEAQPQE